MNFEVEKYHKNLQDEELIHDLKSVAEKIQKNTVTIAEYNVSGQYHSTTLTRRFGSWFTCLELAGLERSRSRLNIPNEELFRNMQQVWVQLGRQPRYEDMQTPISQYCAGTYINKFGSWATALESFAEYASKNSLENTISSKDLLIGTETRKKTPRNVNLRLRYFILQRDNYKCKRCGNSPAMDGTITLHIDHITPWSKGGETAAGNLQTLCSNCNFGKSNLI